MKRTIIISIITAAVLVSCGKEGTCDGETGVQANFLTTITRVTGTSWDNGDRIGVTMVANGTANVQEYQNIAYTTTGNGTFTAVTAAQSIYFPIEGTQRMDFIAYYPYSADIEGYVYPVDVSDQSSQQQFDLLTARSYDQTPAGYDKNSPDVSLVFLHRLSRLIVVASAGAGVDDLTGMTVSVNGLPTITTFDISTGAFSDADQISAITLIETNDLNYEGILIPVATQVERRISVDFTIGDQVYTWYAPVEAHLESGHQHTWTIRVERIPVLIDVEIVPWGDGPGGTGEAS